MVARTGLNVNVIVTLSGLLNDFKLILLYKFYTAVLLFCIKFVSEFLATDTEVPGSIPGATRFSE